MKKERKKKKKEEVIKTESDLSCFLSTANISFSRGESWMYVLYTSAFFTFSFPTHGAVQAEANFTFASIRLHFAPTHLEEELAGTSSASLRKIHPVGAESNNNARKEETLVPSLVANRGVAKRCGVKTVNHSK